MQSSRPAPDDAVKRIRAAMSELRARVDGASASDVETLTFVIESATELSKRLTDTIVPVQHHAELRAELDEVMSRIHELTGRLVKARDEVGEALAAIRRRQRVTIPDPGASRIDLRS